MYDIVSETVNKGLGLEASKIINPEYNGRERE
jgi:hypothetical protein